MAKEEKKQDKKPTKSPEQIEAEKAAKVAKKAEMAAKAKEAVSGSSSKADKAETEAPKEEGKPAHGAPRAAAVANATKAAKPFPSRRIMSRASRPATTPKSPPLSPAN